MRFQTERGLDQGRQTGHRTRMPDIGLGAADIAGVLRLFGTENSAKGFRLKEILRRQAAAMGFQVTD